MTKLTNRVYACAALIVLLLALPIRAATGGSESRARVSLLTSGGRLFYETAGPGPVIVIIHGGQMHRRMWDREFTEYSKHYRVEWLLTINSQIHS